METLRALIEIGEENSLRVGSGPRGATRAESGCPRYGGGNGQSLEVGVDVGREFHWPHVLDASGSELLSRKLENDEADISKLIDETFSLAEEVLRTVDQPGVTAALLLGSLWE